MLNPPSDRQAIRRAYLRFSLIYWGGACALSTVLWLVKVAGTIKFSRAMIYLAEKLFRYSSGWVIACAVAAALSLLHRKANRHRPPEDSLPVLILFSLAITLIAAPLWIVTMFGAQSLFPQTHMADYHRNDFVNDTALGAALYFGWCCLYISLMFGIELTERRLRLAAIREESLAAQMRALRYQINPHFLFNTLNSVAGLIEEGASSRAGRMVLSLSTFLRTTLSLDPVNDLPLADELALQEEYLAIERERFSDRMSFSFDIADDVQQALIPGLILQPLIENAVKHGVNATLDHTGIVLRAGRNADRLVIKIDNDMPTAPAGTASTGMGIGLRNVAERLQARYPDDSRFAAGPIAPGRFRAMLEIPLHFAAD